MIDIETIKTIATEDWEINWPSKTVLELITRLEAAESKQILGASARHFKQMEAAESQLAAQELVIQQLHGHIADSAGTTAIALRKAWQLGQTYWQQADSESYSQQDKSPATQERFSKLVSDTCVEINEALAIPTSTEHLEAWYKEMVGEPTGYYFRDDPEKFAMPGSGYSHDYPTEALDVVPLHAIKPFKGE